MITTILVSDRSENKLEFFTKWICAQLSHQHFSAKMFAKQRVSDNLYLKNDLSVRHILSRNTITGK